MSGDCSRVSVVIGDSGTGAKDTVGGETRAGIACTNVEVKSENTKQERKGQVTGVGVVTVTGETKVHANLVTVTKTHNVVRLDTCDTLGQAKHRQHRRGSGKENGL